jgi:hypothetical protein
MELKNLTFNTTDYVKFNFSSPTGYLQFPSGRQVTGALFGNDVVDTNNNQSVAGQKDFSTITSQYDSVLQSLTLPSGTVITSSNNAVDTNNSQTIIGNKFIDTTNFKTYPNSILIPYYQAPDNTITNNIETNMYEWYVQAKNRQTIVMVIPLAIYFQCQNQPSFTGSSGTYNLTSLIVKLYIDNVYSRDLIIGSTELQLTYNNLSGIYGSNNWVNSDFGSPKATNIIQQYYANMTIAFNTPYLTTNKTYKFTILPTVTYTVFGGINGFPTIAFNTTTNTYTTTDNSKLYLIGDLLGDIPNNYRAKNYYFRNYAPMTTGNIEANIVSCSQINLPSLQIPLSRFANFKDSVPLLYNKATNAFQITQRGLFYDDITGSTYQIDDGIPNNYYFRNIHTSTNTTYLPVNPFVGQRISITNSSALVQLISSNNTVTNAKATTTAIVPFVGCVGSFQNTTTRIIRLRPYCSLIVVFYSQIVGVATQDFWLIEKLDGYRLPYTDTGIVFTDSGTPNIAQQYPIMYNVLDMANVYTQDNTATYTSQSGSAVGSYLNAGMTDTVDMIIVYPQWGLIAYDTANYAGSIFANFKNNGDTVATILPSSLNNIGSVKIFFHDVEIIKPTV